MAGKPQTNSIFRVPEPTETIDNQVTSKKVDIAKLDDYRDFIRATSGYEATYSDIFNQGALFLIERDPAYKRHREGSSNGANRQTAKTNKAAKDAKDAKADAPSLPLAQG